jgi:DinB superfamily
MSANKAEMTATLPADLQSVMDELDRSDEEARRLVAELSDGDLNWQPGGGTGWSVAQCLDHLGQINSVYTVALRTAVREADPKTMVRRGAIHPGWFGRWFIRELEPPPRRKLKSPKSARPAAQKSGQEVLSAFIAAHNELRALIHEAHGLDLNRLRFRNPFIGVLRFTVGTGMMIINAHDRRHLWQARQVGEQMKGRAGADRR